MLSFEEYARHDGLGLAALIADGEVTGAEVHATAHAAVRAVDEQLDAVVEGPWEEPLDHAADGSFGGVPFVLKDIVCHATGVPMHFGSRVAADGVPFDGDSLLMQRFKRAGLATVATAKTPELALSAWTEPVLGGPVRSPWNPQKSPGGSSGGPAALLASGAIPVTHANDGGGSIRIPASYCGLVGLKPSRGRVPIGPGYQEIMFGNAVEFALTRTVRDSAALYDLVHGFASGERCGAPQPERPFFDEVGERGRRLRIAVCLDDWAEVPVHPQVRRVVEQTAEVLRGLGHEVVEARPELVWDDMNRAFRTTWCAGVAATTFGLADALGVEADPDHFEATTLTCAREGLKITPLDLQAAFDTMNVVTRSFAAFFGACDALLSPVSHILPPDIGTYDADDPDADADTWVRRVTTPFPLCAAYNITGGPAISVPVGQSDDGLPIGVQIGADTYREDVLYQLAGQLEEAMPWSDRRPQIHVSTVGAATGAAPRA
ncbi:MAG: amidase [Solirubrobacteraceae bacterium]